MLEHKKKSLRGQQTKPFQGQWRAPHRAIVTGASSGIGEVIARRLAADGHRLLLVARRLERVEALAHELDPWGGNVLACAADITKPEDRERAFALAQGTFGAVTLLINNAGLGGTFAWWNREDEIRPVLETNLFAAIEMTRLVLPAMLERRCGHIINIGSVLGQIPGSSLYGASKFGLRGFSLSLRRELRAKGVDVSLVSPGFIRTSMTDWLRRVPLPGPEVVATAVARVLERPRAELVVPAWYQAIISLEHALPGLGDLFARLFFARRGTS